MAPSLSLSLWPRRQAAVSRFLLCLVLFDISISTKQHFIAWGFVIAPAALMPPRQHSLASSSHRILLDPTRPFHYSLSSPASSFGFFMSKKDHDSQGDTDKEEQVASQQQQQKDDETQKASNSKSNLPNNKDNNKDLYAGLKSVLRNTFDAINTIWSIVILFLGVSISCGLVLNLLGYGYQVNPTAITLLLKQSQDGSSSSSPPPLLRIDTIERFRQEAQFQREINNSMKEKRQRDDASAASASATAAATVVSTITATVTE